MPANSLLRLTVLVAAIPSPSQGQSAAPARPATDSKPAQDFSKEPAVYEYIRGGVRFENDATGTRVLRGRLQIQTPVGLTAGGQLVFECTAVDETVEIPSVKVLKLDGTTVTAGPEAIQDQSAPVAREAPMSTDAREKHVTVPVFPWATPWNSRK